MQQAEYVILVNEQDECTGEMEKLAAHEQGLLHRAFSVFIFNSRGEMLLQQRSPEKYHSGGLWTNACCSHPRPGESTLAAATRRLQEEMGFTTAVSSIFDFIYLAKFENGLTEYEYDHVFAGEYEGPVQVNAAEVAAFAYYGMEDLRQLLQAAPQQFTAWFRIAFPKIEEWWKEHYGLRVA
jgi:isopentenyl-diphosphate delta-isomerase